MRYALRVPQDTCGSLGRPAIVHGVTDQHVLIAVDLTEYGDCVVMRIRNTRSPTSRPTPSVDDARSFALARIGAAQFSCLDTLWQHESDWDPSAENPTSGAYGIAQALPAARMASIGKDWMSNPITQVSWGLEYIAGRYGTACNAWSFWRARYPHWY